MGLDFRNFRQRVRRLTDINRKASKFYMVLSKGLKLLPFLATLVMGVMCFVLQNNASFLELLGPNSVGGISIIVSAFQFVNIVLNLDRSAESHSIHNKILQQLEMDLDTIASSGETKKEVLSLLLRTLTSVERQSIHSYINICLRRNQLAYQKYDMENPLEVKNILKPDNPILPPPIQSQLSTAPMNGPIFLSDKQDVVIPARINLSPLPINPVMPPPPPPPPPSNAATIRIS